MEDFEKLQKDKILRDIREIVENIDKISSQVNMFDELIKEDFMPISNANE
ncbi:hypothetical protein IKQ26_08515 [bacterium]|nr:hypothetical protein [bacterium]